MNLTTLSDNGSALLSHAISKLRPEVFSHPIWVYFGKQETAVALNTIDDLLSAAKDLQERDPSAACQALLICAFYQNDVGQPFNALRMTQQAHALAERSGLPREKVWALWGACAISIQQGDYEGAASYFMDLQTALNKQNEWIVANFVDVVKQSLPIPVTVHAEKLSRSPRDQPFEDLLALTFDWLQKWGYFAQSFIEHSATTKKPVRHSAKRINSIQLFFSMQGWKDGWQSLVRLIKREKVRISQDATHTIKDSTFPPTTENSYPKASSSELRPVLINKKVLGQSESGINVVVQMLGPFNLTIQDTLIKLPNSRSLSLLKYMFLHHIQSIPREVLMDVFWPDVEPEAARNNLNVALHALRKELHSITDLAVICHENGAYCLSSDLTVWLDVDEFEQCIKTGNQMEAGNQMTAAVAEYEIAVNLYQGDFLVETPYEDWTIHDRELLRVVYLDTLDHLSRIYFSQGEYGACTMLYQRILTMDNCSENAHRRLMRCYCRQGQKHLALRQYQVCVKAIREELNIAPMPATNQLYEQIRRGQQV